MSELYGSEDGGRRRRNRIGLILAAVVAVVIVIVILAVAHSRRAVDIVPPPASTPTVAASSSGSATAGSSTSTVRPTAEPSGTATRTAASEPASSAPTATGGNQTTKTPVPIDKDSEVKPGLTARVEKAEAVTGKAEGPGEVGGPAVRFTVVVDNTTAEKADLSTTVVNLYYGDERTPGSPIEKPGGAPLPVSVAAGEKARGTYLFVVPRDSRDKVLITVDYSVDTSVVAFEGKAPR